MGQRQNDKPSSGGKTKPPKKLNKIFHLPMFKPWRCSVEFRVAHETDAKIPVALKAQRAAETDEATLTVFRAT